MFGRNLAYVMHRNVNFTICTQPSPMCLIGQDKLPPEKSSSMGSHQDVALRDDNRAVALLTVCVSNHECMQSPGQISFRDDETTCLVLIITFK